METNAEINFELGMETDMESDVESDMENDMIIDEDEVEILSDRTTDDIQILSVNTTDDVQILSVNTTDDIQILSEKNIPLDLYRNVKKLGQSYRPPLSYACLIYLAFKNYPLPRMRVTQVYTFITKYFPYFSNSSPPGWKNSIRHNLSMNRNFSKHIASKLENQKYERHCLWILTVDRLSRMDIEMRQQMKKHWTFISTRCIKYPKQLSHIVEGTVNMKINKDQPLMLLENETLPGRPLYLNDANLKFTSLEPDDKRLGVILYSKTVPLPLDFYSEEYSINPDLPIESIGTGIDVPVL